MPRCEPRRVSGGAGGSINISQNARKVVFVGTFTAGGLKIGVDDGQLQIKTEGRAPKFLEHVEQITFAGGVAQETGQSVLYITERCVFELTQDGLELIEIAPGVDLERDILAQMAFKPIIREPAAMDRAIFTPDRMGLRERIVARSIADRITYDRDLDTLFLNFENLHVRTRAQVTEIFDAVVARCGPLDRKVSAIVNYDGFKLDPEISDAYTHMVNVLVEKHYKKVIRYTSNAFLKKQLSGIQDFAEA